MLGRSAILRLMRLNFLSVLNLFTNYVNVAFRMPVDFPAVKLRPVRRGLLHFERTT